MNGKAWASAFGAALLVTGAVAFYPFHHRGGTPGPGVTPSPVSTPVGGSSGASPTVTPSPQVPTPKPATPTPVFTDIAPSTPMPTAQVAGPFSAPGNYPPAGWVPFAANSVWNTKLTGAEKADPHSASYMAAYSGQSFFSGIQSGYTNSANDFSHPMYYGNASDPTFTVSCNQSWAICSQFASTKWHIPVYAQPAGGSDHHLGVVDQTSGKVLSCWLASAPKNGVLTAGSCNFSALTGPGVGENPGATAAGYPLNAGVIRDAELIAGTIPHALAIIAPCLSNTSVFPSIPRSSDTLCASGAPYGGRLKLTLTPTQIAALNVPRDHKTILTAAATYGFYVMDTNNNNGFGLQFESDRMYTAAGYTNASCPNNGAPCTPLTAYFHSEGDPGWTGDRYDIDLSHDVNWTSSGRWLLPPG